MGLARSGDRNCVVSHTGWGVSCGLDPHRNERVSETLREELEELVNYELSDPRIGQVTISEVHVSPDYRHAHIQLVLSGNAQQQADLTARAIQQGAYGGDRSHLPRAGDRQHDPERCPARQELQDLRFTFQESTKDKE